MSFFVTGGSLQSDAPSYVERQADRELLDSLLAGEFCYVLTARQMGKSSLMVRTAQRLREAAINVAALDLTAIGGQNVLPDQWYQGLLDTLGQALDLEDELETFWQSHTRLGPVHRFMKALRTIVLTRLDAQQSELLAADAALTTPDAPRRSPVRLVIFVDEIDFVRSLPFATDEFFAAIRQCYNHRTLHPLYQHLTFCLLGVASPSDLIRDTRTTPFNIGRRIELNDFTKEEAAVLASGLQFEHSAQAGRRAIELLSRILHWTEGHPYLTQRLCRVTAETLQHRHDGQPDSDLAPAALVDRVCEDLFFSHRARERDDNLIFVRERLLRDQTDRTTLLELYRKIWRQKRVMDDELDALITTLRLAGVVRVRNGRLEVRNRIYARVFDGGWVRANMPEAELRRERAAFQRGVLLTGAVSVAVLGVMAYLIVLAIYSSNVASVASARAYYSQARAERVSGRAGHRFESLAALKGAALHFPRDGRPDLRDEAIACLALTDLRRSTRFPVPREHACFVRTDNFEHYAAGDLDGTVRFYSGGDSQPKVLPGEGTGVRQMRFSRDERWLAVEYRGQTTNFLTVWDLNAAREAFRVQHGVSHRALDFTALGGKLIVGQTNGTVAVYSVPDGAVQSVVAHYNPGEPRQPLLLRASPTMERVAMIRTGDQEARLFDLQVPGEDVKLYHGDVPRDLAWHPRGDTLAAACEGGLIYLWAVDTRARLERTLSGHEGRVLSVTFSHRGDLIASSGTDRTIRIWTTSTQRYFTLPHEATAFTNLQFSAGDSYLRATAEEEQIWDVAGGIYNVLEWKPAPNEQITSIDFSPDNQLLLAATNDRLLLWDPWTGTLQRESMLSSPVQSAAFMLNRNEVLVSQNSGLFRGTFGAEADSHGIIESFRPPGAGTLHGFGQIVLAATAKRVAVPQESRIQVFDLVEPSKCFALGDELVRFESLAISQNGRWLAAFASVASDASIDTEGPLKEKPLRLWDLQTHQEVLAPGPILSSRSFAFTPNDKWLAVSARGVYSFYAVGSWQSVSAYSVRPSNGQEPAALLAFARDTNLMAVADSHCLVRLLRLSDEGRPVLERVAQLEPPDRSQFSMMALSPNGHMLAAVTQSGLIQVWNLAAVDRGLQDLGLGPL